MTSLSQTLPSEYLNFRHAANALGVSQSSVSARIKRLEEELGILLFKRHARGVRLTDARRKLIERVLSDGVVRINPGVAVFPVPAARQLGKAVSIA
jgi:DNA-binding MarR family transcriptional regulator